MGLTALLGGAYAAWVPLEEEHLSRVLGATYTDYQQQTPRWWGPASTLTTSTP